MGWLSSLFAGKPAAPPASPLHALFATYAGAVTERQLYLDELGQDDGRWNLDPAKGVLLFHGVSLAVQVIAIDEYGSWKWAYEAPENAMPAHMLRAAHRLKELVATYPIPELHSPAVELEKVPVGAAGPDGAVHTLATIAAGLLDADAFYRCPFGDGQGAVWVVVIDPAAHTRRAPSLVRMNRVLGILQLSGFPVDYHLLFESYLRHHGLTGTSANGAARVSTNDGTLAMVADRNQVRFELKTGGAPSDSR